MVCANKTITSFVLCSGVLRFRTIFPRTTKKVHRFHLTSSLCLVLDVLGGLPLGTWLIIITTKGTF